MTTPSPEAESLETGVFRSTRGEVEFVTVRGAIDLGSVESFKSALNEATSRPSPKVVVVCEEINFINSTGIGALYSCQCNCQKAQGTMVLCRATTKLQELVAMIGLQEVFVQAESEDDAVVILTPDVQPDP